jgi:RNA polymerase nonessential primary-like sigma factor
MTKTIDKFISEIKSEPLSPEEELRLFTIYQNRQQGWQEAKDTIINSCLLYVVKCANSYQPNQNKIEDLISEGVLGLLDAFEKFELNNRARFLTFATFSIRGKMLRYLSRSCFNPAFSVPPEIAKMASNIKKYIEEWEEKHKQTPSKNQIKIHFGIDDNILSHTYALIRAKSFSLDYGFNDDSNKPIEIEDANIVDASLDFQRKESRTILEEIISNLPLKQKLVITKRFGLDNTERKDLASIGEELALTKQRVAQIEIEALKTIKREIKKSEISLECLQ